ncbi:MAG TPA: hypothetical protein VGI39_01440 [Polyangiaceae bacterium]|jgi:hypothetical protein
MVDFEGTHADPLTLPPERDWSRLLEEMTAAVEKIRRDYPDPPIRWELAFDLYEQLKKLVPAAMAPESGLTALAEIFGRGTPIVVAPWRQPGEWGPIFKAGR